MSHIHLTKEFTTDEREGDVVSIALVLSEEADELWRRSFDEWIHDKEWLGDSDGVILGYSFPYSYDENSKSKIEIRTHHSTIDDALTTVARTIEKVNEERTEATNRNPKTVGEAELTVQAWFDRS